MTWILGVLGVALIGVALRDIYATLWHPQGLGTLARLIFRTTWWTAARARRHGRALGAAGPVGMIVTVLMWAALIVAGFALIYAPHMPDGFSFTSAPQPQSSDPVAALYLSLVTVATLGYGDITPAYPALQLVIPAQALIGFVLFTAAISWILQIYPALIRRRAAARTVSLLAATDATTVVREGETSVACALLDGLTDALITVELDLRQYGETYYFREAERDRSSAAMFTHVPAFIRAGGQSESMEVRSAAARLERQSSSLAEYLDGRYLHTAGSMQEVWEAYAAAHRHQSGG
ncbi:potassium channel family protein [Gordonia hongkongensis]|uniref:Potassium channel family protein n=1 Tax=Gordonia hongkongensis TaxID=1701090 RepID=A0ABT6C088_9ACTN|nr:potassium channel family protein [Gordonia hongkongensis]MDF6102759.1 potassium channel family protein [Gordonia hongkongensis]